jgi:DNA (cytosine-5)-methyltransferase 1
MNELALFAGAGGGILGGTLLGWRTVCAVEIDRYAASVLCQRQNDNILAPFPVWDDIRTFDGKQWKGIVDVVSGGFPCQDISSFGKGVGIEGKKSGLWKQFKRIIGEVSPKYVFIENSPRLPIRGLDQVLSDLTEMGYDAQWGVIGAVHTGLITQRLRIWIVAADPTRIRWQRRECKPEKITIPRSAFEKRIEEFEGLARSVLQHAIPAGKHKRMAERITNRMDRLKAVGNIQVPAVVKLAWETFQKENTNEY